MKIRLFALLALTLALSVNCEREFGVNRHGRETQQPVDPSELFIEPEIVHVLYGSGQFVVRWKKAVSTGFRSYGLYESFSADMSQAVRIFTSENLADTCHAVNGIEKNQTRYYQVEYQYADSTVRQKSVATASSHDRILLSGHSWSPMGVTSVDINGNWLVRIASNGWLADPSMDGKKIVFCSTANGTDFAVETVNTDGTGRQFIADSMCWNGVPEFDADGGRIVYVAYRNRVPCVHTAASDGSGQICLTDAESISPHFTADGIGIVYHRRSRFGPDYLYRMNADGTDHARVGTMGVSGGLDVSPNGDQIIFESQLEENFGLCSIRMDGSDYRVLVTSPGCISDERFSPDGTKIVYTALTGPTSEIADLHIINADGSGNLLLKWGGDNRFPRFSPDGSRIIFECYNGMDPGVYIVNTDGSGLTRVGGESFGAQYPVFLTVE
jgi:Tol biopolymer transport system component